MANILFNFPNNAMRIGTRVKQVSAKKHGNQDNSYFKNSKLMQKKKSMLTKNINILFYSFTFW